MPRYATRSARRERLARLSSEGLPAGLLVHARRLARLRDGLAAILSKEEAAHFLGVSAHADRLVVFADSPAWCTRLRYRAPEIEAAAEPLLGSRPRLAFKVQLPVFRSCYTPRPPLPQSAVKALEAAARSIEDESLAAALRRLAGHDV